MHRRPLGRGRTLAAIASVLLLVACLLPWYSVGGGAGLPLIEERAFDGSGILAFLAALLVLALMALPYASVGRPVAIDAWPAYLLLLIVALLGVVAWPIQYLGVDPAGLVPTRAPGYWIAVVGVLVLARAVFEIHREPVSR